MWDGPIHQGGKATGHLYSALHNLLVGGKSDTETEAERLNRRRAQSDKAPSTPFHCSHSTSPNRSVAGAGFGTTGGAPMVAC